MLAVLLAACGRTPDDAPRQDDSPRVSRPAAGADVTHGGEDRPGHGSERLFTSLEDLPATRTLQVTVEGQSEAREARLFQSPQGYAIYVLPQLVMTPEEPCCDLAYARVDDGFFMRIERIDDGADVQALAGDMRLALSSVGAAQDADVGAYLPGDAGIEIELSMRAVGEGVSTAMLVMRLDGGRYRVTQHLPHREGMEGIAPSFWAMLGSLRTTEPRPEV